MFARSKLLVNSARSRVTDHKDLLPLRNWLLRLSEREMRIVEPAWRSTGRPVLRYAAISVTRLGNGPAYLLMAAILLLAVEGAVVPVALAALSILLAHLFYPWVKLGCARQRPCELRLDLDPRLPPLDRHSFPSGHSMTMTAALVPMVAAFPGFWPGAILLWLAMAWSRVACGHHYPTDVLAGTLLAVSLAVPLTWFLGG
jgi:undecaprenyl-diphosphatase